MKNDAKMEKFYKKKLTKSNNLYFLQLDFKHLRKTTLTVRLRVVLGTVRAQRFIDIPAITYALMAL